MTKNESAISLNVSDHQLTNHMMNVVQILVMKIYVIEQNDDMIQADDQQLDLLLRLLIAC